MLKKKILPVAAALGVLALSAAAHADSTQVLTTWSASRDAWYGYAAGLTTLSGANLSSQDGWLARVSGGYGQFNYNTVLVPGGHVDGTAAAGDLMAGYQHYDGPTRITIFLGGSLDNIDLSPPDPKAKINGTRGGVKAQLELFTMVTDKIPASIIGNYSTGFETYWSQATIGYNFGPLTVGPLIGFQGNEAYNQVRYGGKISGVDLGFAQASLDVGGLHQNSEAAAGGTGGAENSVFGTVGLFRNF